MPKIKGMARSVKQRLLFNKLSDMPWQSLHSQHKPEEERAEGEYERRKELEQMEFEMLSVA